VSDLHDCLVVNHGVCFFRMPDPTMKKNSLFLLIFFLKGPDSDGFTVDSVNKIREKCTKPDKVDLVVVVLCSDRGVSSRHSNTGKTFYLSETSINFLIFFSFGSHRKSC